MEEKLNAICDAIDFIELAIKEIVNYNDLKDIKDGLDDLKSELSEKYELAKDKYIKIYGK